MKLIYTCEWGTAIDIVAGIQLECVFCVCLPAPAPPPACYGCIEHNMIHDVGACNTNLLDKKYQHNGQVESEPSSCMGKEQQDKSKLHLIKYHQCIDLH
jgi:hypothetical protein